MDKKILRDIAFSNAHNPNKRKEYDYLFRKAVLETGKEKFHNIKRAKIDEYIFDNYTIEIGEYDLLAGRFSNSFEITEERQKVIEKANIIIENTEMMNGTRQASTNHRVIDYEKLLSVGIKGVLEEIDKKILIIDYSKPDDAEKLVFYKSMKISLNAVCRFAKRFYDTLNTLSEGERKPERKKQLLRMAENFKSAPYEPCTNFYEAVQCMWFMQFALCLVDDITLTGRPDNYLYPYYKKDIENGVITKEFAFELIEQLYFKNNEIYGDWPASLMIGGVDRMGNPVWNDLSYMCIDAIETTGLINPSVSVCYTEDMPRDLLEKCIYMISKGYTRPSIFNDKIIQEGLKKAGVSEEDARYYIHSTCVEITPIAAANILVATPYVNLCKAFEYILSEKKMPYVVGTLRKIGPGYGGDEKETYIADDLDFSLSDLDSFDKFWDFFKNVISEIIKAHVLSVCNVSLERKLYSSSPLSSALLNDCIERGKDAAAGGAKYNFCYPNFPGIINLIDSLAAIKQAVYEEKIISLKELAKLCDTNFENAENIRQYILNKCPKFGNNMKSVDEIGAEIFDFIYGELRKYKQCLGGEIYPSYFAYIYHGLMGSLTWATPDGRLEGEALSEHLGAVQGRDKNGPIAMMRSISKVDQRNGIGGIATNYRFSKTFAESENGRKAIADFVKIFMDNGCFEIQFNVVDRNDLLKAQKNPEKYKTLMVRVAGYSDYFTNLSLNVQNEILKRTEYGEI